MSKLTVREQMDLNNLRLAFRDGLVPAEHREKAIARYAELLSKLAKYDVEDDEGGAE